MVFSSHITANEKEEQRNGSSTHINADGSVLSGSLLHATFVWRGLSGADRHFLSLGPHELKIDIWKALYPIVPD